MDKIEKNIVLIQFIVGFGNLLHSGEQPSVETFHKLLDSCNKFNVPVYFLTNMENSFKYPGLHPVKMPLFKYDNLTAYFHRLDLSYRFLLEHPEVEKIAYLDATDVVMNSYPFDQVQPDTLYFGDETFKLKDLPLMEQDPTPEHIKKFLLQNSHLQVLNLGTTIATRTVMMEYLGILNEIISQTKLNNARNIEGNEIGNFEMNITNYVPYRYFKDRLVHGRKVNSVFGAWEPDSTSWFKHK